MKWLNIILSIYLIILSCMPCTDDVVNVDVSNSSHSELTLNHENHSHDDKEDTCPPFCICNCCGIQVMTYSAIVTFDFPFTFKKIQPKHTFYKSTLSSSFFGRIWQPPQLV